MKFKILLLSLLPYFLHADSFLTLNISDLSFRNGEKPPVKVDNTTPYALQYSRSIGRYIPSNLPYCRTKDASEAFISFRKKEISSSNRDSFSSSDLVVCFRNPKPKVEGHLFLYHEPDGWKPIYFTFEKKNDKNLMHEQKSEDEYLSYRVIRYEWLQELRVPGTAWYRHQITKDRNRLAQIRKEPRPTKHTHSNRATLRPPHNTELENSMDLFSGGRAISENLQLNRELRLSSDEQNRSISLSSLPEITIDEIPWKEWIKEEQKPTLDPIASLLPHDQHAVIFSSYTSMLKILDEATARGTPLLRLGENRAESARSKEKYSRQLCLPIDNLSRMLGPKLISSVAMTGSDPFFRTGTSLTLIFETEQKQGLLAALKLRRMEAQKKFPKAQAVKGSIPQANKHKYVGINTQDRLIQSFVCSFGNFVVVTNSMNQLSRLARVFDKKEINLASLEEYHFFRQRYRITPQVKEDAFLMITDATIRRWCGAEWRIGASRRTRAASAIAELQARIESGTPLNAKEFPELGKVSVIDGLVQSAKFGNLAFLKSVEELNIKKITPAEKKAYEFFRDRYQSHWSKYFDPISAQLSIHQGKIKGDLSVLPLIGGTDYRNIIQTVGDVKLKPKSGDPHPEASLHWISAIDMNSPRFKKASNFAAIMAPSLGAGAFSWIGESFSFFLDESVFLTEAQDVFVLDGQEAGENFIEENFGRIPLGFNIEVRNPFKLTAFLTGLRAWIEQTAPGMTHWSSKSYRKQGYVKIAPGKDMEVDLIMEGSSPVALYYVPATTLFTVSLSEDIIKRAIDRNLDRREKRSQRKMVQPEEKMQTQENTHSPTLPEVDWAGMSSAFHLSSSTLSLFYLSLSEKLNRVLQKKSWNNLYALNEWKLLLKQDDPLAYHQAIWQTDLHCPGRGKYVWNQKFQTFESTAFGHPAKPKEPKSLNPLSNWKSINFGINFEKDGLRAKATARRKK